jgi:hypothetical protein
VSRRRRRAKKESLPPRWQWCLLGAVLMLRCWLAVIREAPPVPAWFFLAAAVMFAGPLGWSLREQAARFRRWRIAR